MTRVCVTLLAALALAASLPSSASAQTQPAAPGSSPIAGRLSIGGIIGVASVQNVGGSVGGEIGFTLTERLDVFAEGLGFEDVVTRRRLALVPIVTNFLQSSQGKAATGDLTAPAGYGGAGVRLMLTRGTLRAYVAFSAGLAKIALTPVFTLGGTDVTTSLSQYGVELGSDLTGDISAAAFGGGGGVRMNKRRWYLDGGIRVTSIRTPDQPTNVLRAEARVGVRF